MSNVRVGTAWKTQKEYEEYFAKLHKIRQLLLEKIKMHKIHKSTLESALFKSHLIRQDIHV